MITYAKVGHPVMYTDDGGNIATALDGWTHIHVVDPATSEAPVDAKGRMILWVEINTREGWGYIFDQDCDPVDNGGDYRSIRVQAPWIRLLRLIFQPPEDDLDLISL